MIKAHPLFCIFNEMDKKASCGAGPRAGNEPVHVFKTAQAIGAPV